MPSVVLAQLRELGENLASARKRRREPLKAWAQRIGVSEPTLMRMEKGDPSVSFGVYATALWLMGRFRCSSREKTLLANLVPLDVRSREDRHHRRRHPDAGGPRSGLAYGIISS